MDPNLTRKINNAMASRYLKNEDENSMLNINNTSSTEHAVYLSSIASNKKRNIEMETIAKERANPSFPVREMTYFIDGGEEQTRYKELANTIIERDSILRKKRPFDLNHDVDREMTMAQVRRGVAISTSIKDAKLKAAFNTQMTMYDRNYSMRTYVHYIIFRETIWAQGTKEQFKKYEEDIEHMRIIGCFAMTELGHSSFLRGLETYAVYDKERQEFIIHSSALTATKWWIGMAGQSATHTVALCNLVIDGKVRGLHWFVVPLRDRNTGNLMPGVSAGHVGAKLGRNGLDNGWIQFSYVRIPRDNMLMKWAKVTADGQYTPMPNPALSYGTLIGERLSCLADLFSVTSQAATIGVRFGAVRRQGEQNQQILDYQSHQYALMPVVACSFALQIMYLDIGRSWNQCQQDFEDTGNEKDYLSKVQDYHAMAAGLKAWFGWHCADALEAVRRTLGGHGYSSYNAIGGLIGDFGVVTTGGGDNIVLAQQAARYLISSLRKAREGKSVGASVSYFKDADSLLKNAKFKAATPDDLLKSEYQLEAFAWLSTTMIASAASSLAATLGSGTNMGDAWNLHMMELVGSTKPHTFYYGVRKFVERIETVKHNARLYPMVKKLCDLFALHSMQLLGMHFLEHGFMTGDQLQMIKKTVLSICKELRKDAVPLVDAFNYPDWLIKAPIGRYDGNIYQAYFDIITNGPDATGRTPYWEKEIAPLTQSSKL